MRRKKTAKPDPQRVAEIIANAKRAQDTRAEGYRERALAIFPHVCARCAREFAGKDLRLLTVHHKDHNHHNNPPDGGNWELLCVYCHNEEHQDPYERDTHATVSRSIDADDAPLSHNPFAQLAEDPPPNVDPDAAE
jgi:hypothetical protein